jgi:hypothetical protein
MCQKLTKKSFDASRVDCFPLANNGRQQRVQLPSPRSSGMVALQIVVPLPPTHFKRDSFPAISATGSVQSNMLVPCFRSSAQSTG